MPAPTRSRRALLRGAAGLLFASPAGCLGGASTDRHVVAMTDDRRFDPETVRVPADATVVWENESQAAHTVTAVAASLPPAAAYFASGGFDDERAARADANGGLVAPGGSYAHTFRQPGTCDYVCLPHEQVGMTGTVVVE